MNKLVIIITFNTINNFIAIMKSFKPLLFAKTKTKALTPTVKKPIAINH